MIGKRDPEHVSTADYGSTSEQELPDMLICTMPACSGLRNKLQAQPVVPAGDRYDFANRVQVQSQHLVRLLLFTPPYRLWYPKSPLALLDRRKPPDILGLTIEIGLSLQPDKTGISSITVLRTSVHTTNQVTCFALW